MSADTRRNPTIYACALGFSVWLGLEARHLGPDATTPIAVYAGDAFWALAIFAAIGLLSPTIATWQAAALAFVLPSLIEYGHWSNAPWLVALRGTPLGDLALGTESVATVLTCYGVGAGVGMLIELWTLD